MFCLIPLDWLPIEWQPLVTFVCGWFVIRAVLASIEPASYRPYMLHVAFGAFASYWTLFGIGADFGVFCPYFGPDGIGDAVLFMTLLMVVGRSLSAVENHLYHRLIHVARLDLAYGSDGIRLTRRPSLSETSGLYKPGYLAE